MSTKDESVNARDVSQALQAVRVLLSEPPFPEPAPTSKPPWELQPSWRACWIDGSKGIVPPFVIAYRCEFTCEKPTQIRIHVTADERYSLHLDGHRIGRGSERGDQANWFFESYDLSLTPGQHAIVALVDSLGGLAPWAQVSIHHGLLVAAQDPAHDSLLTTGVARWTAKKVQGIAFYDCSNIAGTALGGGPGNRFDGEQFDPSIVNGTGDGWHSVAPMHSGNNGFHLQAFSRVHLLRPAMLPPMIDRPIPAGTILQSSDTTSIAAWNALLQESRNVIVPIESHRTLIVEHPDYFCFYPSITLRGAGSVTLTYLESINQPSAGGMNDQFVASKTEKRFEPRWWRAGRFVRIELQSRESELIVSQLGFAETRYPLDPKVPHTSDPQSNSIVQMCLRTLQCCCHETFMDCPYYEQLMYAGDTRLQALCLYRLSEDDRPMRKAIELFNASRRNAVGITTEAYPGNTKFIPPFSLIWIEMVGDFAKHRDDPAFVAKQLPGIRAVLDVFFGWMDSGTALLRSPRGWNYVDATCAPFSYGVPPGGVDGFSATINLQLLLAIRTASWLERDYGDSFIASRFAMIADELAKKIQSHFWNQARARYAEEPGKDVFTAHAQSLAIIAELPCETVRRELASALVDDRQLIPATAYFLYHVFEALRATGQGAAIEVLLEPWKSLVKEGRKTTPETFGTSRSLCHAWSAHPLLHYMPIPSPRHRSTRA